jgi:hypothetical protein
MKSGGGGEEKKGQGLKGKKDPLLMAVSAKFSSIRFLGPFTKLRMGEGFHLDLI